MPMSSQFLTESTGEKMVKIGQYLAKIWTKYDSLLFLGHPVETYYLDLIALCDLTWPVMVLIWVSHEELTRLLYRRIRPLSDTVPL